MNKSKTICLRQVTCLLNASAPERSISQSRCRPDSFPHGPYICGSLGEKADFTVQCFCAEWTCSCCWRGFLFCLVLQLVMSDTWSNIQAHKKQLDSLRERLQRRRKDPAQLSAGTFSTGEWRIAGHQQTVVFVIKQSRALNSIKELVNESIDDQKSRLKSLFCSTRGWVMALNWHVIFTRQCCK